MRRLLALMVLVAGVSDAGASPLTDALARHSERDIAALRGRPDPASRCTLGAIHARRGDLSRAALYLTGCADAELPAEVAGEITRIARELHKQLRDSDLARIEVVTTPPGMTATITAFPGEPFVTPATLYLSAGDYEVEATVGGILLKNVVHAVPRSRGAVVLEAGGSIVGGKIVKDGSIDFEDEGGGGGEQHAGPPPPIKHKNLMNEKYVKGLKQVATTEPNPNALEDPFAIRDDRRTARPLWLGLRLGGGMFDDGASRARAGVAIAATTRLAITPRGFLAGRLDWSRRGGELAVDTIGASAGAGLTVVESRVIGLAVIAQLRGDLRFGAMAERAGATAAAGLEASLPRSPFTAGLRFEQGLTALTAGTRDRAVLFELGVDWR